MVKFLNVYIQLDRTFLGFSLRLVRSYTYLDFRFSTVSILVDFLDCTTLWECQINISLHMKLSKNVFSMLAKKCSALTKVLLSFYNRLFFWFPLKFTFSIIISTVLYVTRNCSHMSEQLLHISWQCMYEIKSRIKYTNQCP